MVNLLDLNGGPIIGQNGNENNDNDGILKIDPKKYGKDNKYTVKLRFLPNIRKDVTIGKSVVDKHVHYIKIPTVQEWSNLAIDCLNPEKKVKKSNCNLCDLFFKLSSSSSVEEQKKKECIMRAPKYYSYVLVIEDEHRPENVGKIMILPYGTKIMAKIEAEGRGENSKEEVCDVFDLANGKDFKLVCEIKGGNNNYDNSTFLDNSPLKIMKEDGKFKPVPTWVNSEGKILFGYEDPENHKKINNTVVNFLMSHESNIEDFVSVGWSDDQKNTVANIWAYLTGAKTKVKSNPFESEDDPFVKDDKKVETKSSASTSEDDSDDGWGF